MPKTIIAGVDGAAGGADALALARRLAGPQSRIVAVSVAPVDAHRWRGANRDFDLAVHADATEALRRSVAGSSGVAGEVVLAACVADGLQQAAERHEADLIVVGQGAREGLDRVLAGDDAVATLRGAPCPVAIAPPAYARYDRPLAVIGVGYDGREEARAALETARRLADEAGAHVRAHEVIGLPDSAGVERGMAHDVNTFVGPDDDQPVALEGLVGTTSTGLAAQRLAEFSEEVDLLVVGSRGRGRLARIALGSTAEALARRLEVPLVVVPRSTRPALAEV